jgi:excisionase family DNA binding protein
MPNYLELGDKLPYGFVRLKKPLSFGEVRMNYLTAEELADKLRVRPRTVKDWARKNRIPAIRLGYKTVRFDPQAVAAAITGQAKEIPMSHPQQLAGEKI